MISPAIKKTAILFSVTLLVLVSTFSFAIWTHEDSVQRIEFSLIDQTGETQTQQNFAGRHMLVFFGYTSCPDICPAQMYKLAQVMEKIEGAKSKLITPVFVTVDPERDTPERLDKYLGYFHESIVGLTGSRIAVENATKMFNTFLQEAPTEGEENYVVAHSSLVYVVDPFGRVVDHISFDTQVDEIVVKIKGLI